MQQIKNLDKTYLGLGFLFGIGAMLVVLGVITMWRGFNPSPSKAGNLIGSQEAGADQTPEEAVKPGQAEQTAVEDQFSGLSGGERDPYILPLALSLSGYADFKFNGAGIVSVATNGSIFLYEQDNLRLIRVINVREDGYHWSPDGTQLLIHVDTVEKQYLELWDARNGTLIWSKLVPEVRNECHIRNHTTASFFAWMGQGETILVILNMERMETWDAQTGEKLGETQFSHEDSYIPIPKTCGFGLAWAPDRVHFALFPPPGEYNGAAPKISIYDGIQRKLVSRWEIQERWGYRNMVFSADSRYLTAINNSIYNLDWKNQKLVTLFSSFDFKGNLDDYSWSPDGTSIALLIGETEIVVYSYPAMEERFHLYNLDETSRIVWTPEGQLVTSSSSTLRFYNPVSGVLEKQLMDFSYREFIGWSPTGQKLALLTRDGNIVIRDFISGEVQILATKLEGEFRQAQWLPDWNMIFVTFDHKVIRVNPAGSILSSWVDPDENTTETISSPDGTRIASVKEGARLVIYDALFMKEILQYTHPGSDGIAGVAFSADGKYFTFYTDSNLYVINVSNGKVLAFPIETVSDPVIPLIRWSPTQNQIAGYLSDENTIWLWDLRTPEVVRTWKLSDYVEDKLIVILLPPGWTPDGRNLVIRGEAGTYLFDFLRERISQRYEFGCEQLLFTSDGGLGVCFDDFLGNLMKIISFAGQPRDFPWVMPVATPRLPSKQTPKPPATFTPATFTPAPTATLFPTATPAYETQLNEKDSANLVFIPGGEFTMGSNKGDGPYFWGAEAPSHTVNVDDFWIYQTEVTNAMYQACRQKQVCPKPAQVSSNTRKDYYENPAFANYPVIYVSWRAATAYCQFAGGRLPTEAEWEKAARGTGGWQYPWGNPLPTSAVLNLNGSDTQAVGQYPAGASPYGAYDMAGNVFEWVFDYFQPLFYTISPTDNPIGPASGRTHVIRGGAYHSEADALRVVARSSQDDDYTGVDIGFRCVIEDK